MQENLVEHFRVGKGEEKGRKVMIIALALAMAMVFDNHMITHRTK